MAETSQLHAMAQGLDRDQRLVLDIAVDYAKKLKIAKSSNVFMAVVAPLLAVQGGAGSGKSRVIDVMSQMVEKILRTTGDHPDHPYVLKTAFTGTAAANIKGGTLSSSFRFPFGNKFSSLVEKTRDEWRTLLENLTILCIDEMSMVKSDMLYQLHLRLKEVKQQDKLFGGVCVLLFGDVLQLQPVKATFIFAKPICTDYHPSYMIRSLWRQFEVVLLRTNHRQGADREYADILNRVRTADMTAEDITVLQTRIRPSGHPDIPAGTLVVTKTNAVVNEINARALSAIDSQLYEFQASNRSSRGEVKPYTDRAGCIRNTSLQAVLKLKIGAKVMMTANVDVSDMLTNGSFGVVVGFDFNPAGKVRYVLVEFAEEDAGKERRKNFTALQSNYPDRRITPVEMYEKSYTRTNNNNTVNSMTAVQFPLRVSTDFLSIQSQG